MQLPQILLDLRQITPSDQPLYLVGGAVRDYLLGKDCRDYDIVCQGQTRTIARQYADHVKGAFFTLDDTRKTYRVLIDQTSEYKTILDFATMQGESINDDLAQRDFTINAMAVDLNDARQIIDPNRGGRDLQEKWLRPVSDKSLINDPLRVVRALRYALKLDLKIEPPTTALISEAVPLLGGVSIERKRDELFKILDGKNIHTALRLLQHFSVFDHFPLPVATDFQRVLDLTRELEEVLGWLTGCRELEKQSSFHHVSLIKELGVFKDRLRAHYLTENPSNRTRKALLYLSILLGHQLDERDTTSADLLALSTEESNSIKLFSRGFLDIERWMGSLEVPKPAAIFDFYRDFASTGVDLVIANLAQYRTRIGADFSQAEWLRRLSNAKTFLQAWFEQPELLDPVPLLNGDDIMQQFDLKPGPLIGELLDRIIHEQVAGTVTTKKEALDRVASLLA